MSKFKNYMREGFNIVFEPTYDVYESLCIYLSGVFGCFIADYFSLDLLTYSLIGLVPCSFILIIYRLLKGKAPK